MKITLDQEPAELFESSYLFADSENSSLALRLVTFTIYLRSTRREELAIDGVAHLGWQVKETELDAMVPRAAVDFTQQIGEFLLRPTPLVFGCGQISTSARLVERLELCVLAAGVEAPTARHGVETSSWVREVANHCQFRRRR